MREVIKRLKDSYQNLPKIPEMRKLYHLGYWDGPLSGMCLVDGQKYFFECIEEWLDNNSYPEDDDDFEAPWYRRYLLWRLTEEQLTSLEERHAKFQRMVGRHTDYDENGKRCNFVYNETITPETVAQYYKEAKEETTVISMEPVSNDMILGWYEWA